MRTGVLASLALAACAAPARPAARNASCAPPATDLRGRVAWNNAFLAGGENGSEALTYDDRNRVATRTIRVDDAVPGVACQGHWTWGPPPCAFRGSGYHVIEYDDRYAYDEDRRPIARTRTTWRLGPFGIHDRPGPDAPRARIATTEVRWTWAGVDPAGPPDMSYQTVHEAQRIRQLGSYDAAGQPMGDAPRARGPAPACAAPPGSPRRWAAIELDDRDRIVQIDATGFGHERVTYDRRDRVATRTTTFLVEGPSQRECIGGWTGEAPTCAGEMVDVPSIGVVVLAVDRYAYDPRGRPIARWRAAWTTDEHDPDRAIDRATRRAPRPGEWARWTWRGEVPIAVEVGGELGAPGVTPADPDALLDEARHVRWLGAPHAR
ncbi:MAG: hypothetical protein K8W52_34580 [Deltaproteobacteria bacterium]|nr:hypothetical protein [Deltaproteobacteria bacterium]